MSLESGPSLSSVVMRDAHEPPARVMKSDEAIEPKFGRTPL